jgi:hypothetical protein
MKMLERYAATNETTALLGPATFTTLFAATCVTSLLFLYRLFTQGYYRVFFSSR